MRDDRDAQCEQCDRPILVSSPRSSNRRSERSWQSSGFEEIAASVAVTFHQPGLLPGRRLRFDHQRVRLRCAGGGYIGDARDRVPRPGVRHSQPNEVRLRMKAQDTSRISPTAHYTSYVWFANGLSSQAFATRLGRFLYWSLAPANAASNLLGDDLSLEKMLLARHRAIDGLLDEEIASGRVTQVVEVAAGLSPRGWRFMERYGDSGLTYVEGDLPAMAAAKARLLERAGRSWDNHHVRAINVLDDAGEQSLVSSCEPLLDPEQGTAIITEGLLPYFDALRVAGIWRRFAAFLSTFPRGLYLSDLSLGDDVNKLRRVQLFRRLLGVVVRGRVHFQYPDVDDAGTALRDCGFDASTICWPDQIFGESSHRQRLVRIIKAVARRGV